jgi:ATP-dependent helicase/nuclease subunit A
MDNEEALTGIMETARILADRFLNSELGILSKEDPLRESEFPVLTAVTAGDKAITITGQIDLLFESGNTLYVVDFKTDQAEEPERHLGQLAVYHRAVSDIFGKPVRSWLFYLRSGNAVELSGRIPEVNIEAMVEAHITALHAQDILEQPAHAKG